MNDESKRKALIEQFFNKIKNRDTLSFVHTSIFPKSFIDGPPNINLLIGSLINIEQISDEAKVAMDALEEYGKDRSEWINFKWKLWAFFEVQTIFDAPFYKHWDELSFFRAWYFYFESRYVLVESLLAGFNGLYQASHMLIRPFFEFNILQNYYYRQINKSSSFFEVNKCLESGINPKWSTLLRGCLEATNFTNPIKARINAHYSALSNHYSHSYHQDFSPKVVYQNSTPGHSLMGHMIFWVSLDDILECILWIYYANFPMLFQPKDILSKFGFNGPMGVFIDFSQEHIFRNALAQNDYATFYEHSKNNDKVLELNKWYDGMRELTVDEIRATWNFTEDGELPDDFEMAKVKRYAKFRVIAEAMSLKSLKPKNLDHIDLSKIDLTYEGWSKRLHRKTGKKK